MEDFIKAGFAFGHMYFSLVLGMWMETEENGDRVGKLIATWFTVLFCRYGISKLSHMGEMDCIHNETLNYWSVFLFTILWRKANFTHSPATNRMWKVMWFISITSVIINHWMSINYDEYAAELLWSNIEIVEEGFSLFMFHLIVITYILLIFRFDIPVLILWTGMLADALSIFEPIYIGTQAIA